jgi:hypothetical protein
MANIFDAVVTIAETKKGTLEVIEKDLEKDITLEFGDIDDSSGVHDGEIEYFIQLKWAINAEQWAKIAKKYKVEIYARGCEDGMGFYQVVQIGPRGGIIKNKELSF